MKTFIAVDLGGTNIRAALVSEDGQILDVKKDKTEAQLGKEALIGYPAGIITGITYRLKVKHWKQVKFLVLSK